MGIRSEDITCQWCRTLSGIVSFMMFHDVSNIAAVSHGSFLICPKMDRCNLIWYCIETVHGTQIVHVVPPHKKKESWTFMWNMYINTYISVTKDPRIHNRRVLQVPWCVACNVAIGWNCWRAKALCSFSRSLGLFMFFSWQTFWRSSLKRTVVKHLKHWGWFRWVSFLVARLTGVNCSFQGICWAPESWWREFDVTTMVQRMNRRMGRVCEFSFVGTWELCWLLIDISTFKQFTHFTWAMVCTCFLVA